MFQCTCLFQHSGQPSSDLAEVENLQHNGFRNGTCRDKIDKSILNSQRDYAQLSDITHGENFPPKFPLKSQQKRRVPLESSPLSSWRDERHLVLSIVARTVLQVNLWCILLLHNGEMCKPPMAYSLQQIASLALIWLPTKTHP